MGWQKQTKVIVQSGGTGGDTTALETKISESVYELNNFKYSYDYNQDGSIHAITEKDATDVVISTTTFTYLDNGDVDTSTKVMDGVSVETKYVYDVDGNITDTINTKTTIIPLPDYNGATFISPTDLTWENNTNNTYLYKYSVDIGTSGATAYRNYIYTDTQIEAAVQNGNWTSGDGTTYFTFYLKDVNGNNVTAKAILTSSNGYYYSSDNFSSAQSNYLGIQRLK